LYDRPEAVKPIIRAGLLLVSLIIGAGIAQAISPPALSQGDVLSVEAAFRQTVQLWAEERFEALWECGLLASRYRVSRDGFVVRMRHRLVKPTCCWRQILGIKVHLQAAEEALVEAQMGFDVKTLGTTVNRLLIVYMRREEGIWRVALEDFLFKPEEGWPW
jgi:hypothetical protein